MAESTSTPHLRSHNRSPSYNSAESGGLIGTSSPNTSIAPPDQHHRSISPPHTPTLGSFTQPHVRHSPRASSPSPGRELGPSGLGGGGGGASGRRGGAGRGHGFDLNVSLRGIGRAVVSRVVRAARRGNLPFIVIFLSCVVIFFSALAGIGYVDPDSPTPGSLTPAPQFIPGAPVFVPNDESEIGKRRRADELRELEKEWQKKRRPREGAWMQKQRDDKAIRRVAVPAPIVVTEVEIDKRDVVEEQKVYDLGGKDEAYQEPIVSDSEGSDGKDGSVSVENVGVGADQLEQEAEEGIELAPEEKEAALEAGGEAAEVVEKIEE